VNAGVVDDRPRCGWARGDALYRAYHDTEWGVPVHDDARLFEFLILDGFQAGLSWLTILRKRDNFRRAFDSFDAEKIARYDENKRALLMTDAGIVRNRAKIAATIDNAKGYLAIREEVGSFDGYMWQFPDGATVQNAFKQLDEIPAETAQSRAMSKDLRARGFRFVGPTICYAVMQAAGMVNDHLTTCFRHPELRR
jgi:DNA-3-methyladenine glycosylase I